MGFSTLLIVNNISAKKNCVRMGGMVRISDNKNDDSLITEHFLT